MNDRLAHILIVDDESSILDSLRMLLQNSGFEVSTAQGGRAGLKALAQGKPDIVLTDIRMPRVTGIDVLQAAKEQDAAIVVILMTAQASLDSAVRAVNEGAYHYIQKPFGNDDLVAICRRGAEYRALRTENVTLKKEIKRRDEDRWARPVGSARCFTDVMCLAEQVAPTESTVLILGESGTGKEVMARYIHRLSARSDGPFLSINCGALPEGLLESELFGHVKGSFTGAVRDKEGLFAAANGGTFFLDEIAEMSPATQVKLLRVLQEREALPVGSTEPVPVDARVIAATNRDLDESMREGSFRSDLYYRLNVIALVMPPLRERREDILVLAEAFLSRMAAERAIESKELSREALDAIQVYDWPGNVRELENALEHAITLTRGAAVDVDALPVRVTKPVPERLVDEQRVPNPTLDTVERAYIEWVLQSEGGNKTRAAEMLGIDPSTLYRKLARYEADPD